MGRRPVGWRFKVKISSALTGALLLLNATSAALSAEDTRPDPGSDPWLVLRNEAEFSGANRITSAYLDSLRRSRPSDSRPDRTTIRDRSSLLSYQRAVRQAILAWLGPPLERTPLNAQRTGTLVREGYRIEKVLFESRPRNYVTANVYVPASGQARFPALLCPVGHWGAGKAAEDYQRFAAYCARRGFVVLCYDSPGQGERIQTFDSLIRRPSVHPGTSEYFVTTEHGYLGSYAFLAENSFARYLLWDGIRALDYLEQRGDVDTTRIACTGASGGGTQTRELAALDERIRITIPVAYGGCAADLIYAPGVDDADVDALIAPRPLLLVAASGDGTEGNERKRRGFTQLATIYETVGARNAIDFVVAESPHGYTAPMYPTVYRWLAKWFGLPEPAPESLVERPIAPESERTLACTLSGQVKTSLGGETVASLSRADARRSRRPAALPADADPQRWRAWQRELLERVRTKLGVASGTTPLEPRTLRRSKQEDFGDERVVFSSDPGVYVPAVLLLPAEKRPAPAIIFVNEEAKSADAAPERYWLPLVRAGYAVLAIDPRGTGETSEGPVPREYRGFLTGTDASLFYGALRAGTSIPAMHVRDVLAACAFLESRSEIDPKRLGILGIGSGGTLATLTAALDARIKVAVSSGGLLSFDAIAASEASTHRLTELVPGALESFDLPDVAALVAPRCLVLANLVDATHRRVDPELARSTYAHAKRAYDALSAENHLRIVDADSSEAIIQELVTALSAPE
jgi:cephalosporin-C deacetylase-like acetyl esterase